MNVTEDIIDVAARALSDSLADSRAIDREDQWRIYGEDFKEHTSALLNSMPEPGSKAAFLVEHLRPGEYYSGLILGKNGEKDYHLFVVQINDVEASWKKQRDWAAALGAALPDRRELNLLRANLRELFKPGWYWCNETCGGDSAYALGQDFLYGGQYPARKSAALRAVAVRRVFLED